MAAGSGFPEYAHLRSLMRTDARLRLSDQEPRFSCQVCGRRGTNIKPLFVALGISCSPRRSRLQPSRGHRDHPPPHFHAIAPDWDALIDIESLMVFQGNVPSAILKEIKASATQHQALLRQTWRTLNI